MSQRQVEAAQWAALALEDAAEKINFLTGPSDESAAWDHCVEAAKTVIRELAQKQWVLAALLSESSTESHEREAER